MDAARKSYEIQTQVRNNAEEHRNSINDLLSWEKEIKEKEKQMLAQATGEEESSTDGRALKTLPIRSHTVRDHLHSSPSPAVNTRQTVVDVLSAEKREIPLKLKEANEIKDKGNKHVKLGEYQLAIEAYTKAINLYPMDAIFFTNRALCYLKLERYDECIEDCDHAIGLDNLAVKAYYRRMSAHESLGNNMDALKDCTSLLTIDPKNGEAKRSLERINERLRKTVKTSNGPNFSPLLSNVIDILPVDKPSYRRSSKSLKRIEITDVVGPKDSKNYENLKISDEDIDKLFNSNCGAFEEIKKTSYTIDTSHKAADIQDTKQIQQVKQEFKQQKSKLNQTSKPKKEMEKLTKEKKGKNRENEQLDQTSNETEIERKEKRPLPPVPTTTAQFYCHWKELTDSQKYPFLKSIPLKQLTKILGAGFDSEILNEVIRTLHDYYLPQKDPLTALTLLEISKNKQTSILSLLMSNDERKALIEIIDSLKEIKGVDLTAIQQINKNFNLN
ncbi:RNA polymerase II-associated protein 3 [Glossina fuscipes]|uniref:RNA polymerase II-associated protein 3 n=1 Tax=Glossina fuscipes TaxID=7396 RepID=A0A9C5Z176_9MUSC|nr:RNA polymerase II-associated protein 3 [Glossina fuscipes]